MSRKQEIKKQQNNMGKINVTLEQCPNCEHCLVRKPNCRVIKNLGYIVFYGKNGECTFFKRKIKD